MGSIMIEENVVRAAGTAFRLDTERMVAAIEATGRRAVQRDTLYRVRPDLLMADIDVTEAHRRWSAGELAIIDCREEQEYEATHVDGSP